MTDPDPILTRARTFDWEADGGYTLTLTAIGAPIVRLKPACPGGSMRIHCRYHRSRWKVVGNMSSLAPPPEEALDAFAKTDIYWTWA